QTLTPQSSLTDDDIGGDHVRDYSISEKLDNARGLAWVFGVLFLGTAIWLTISSESAATRLGFVTPDWINLILLGLALLAHGSIKNLLSALEKAIGGASGILLQFPIYFGIMGVVTGTGLVTILSGALVSSTNITTLPLAIFTSSGLLNIFVPSGGGQWAVQGPLVIEACHSMGMSLEKGIMAMAYGDQWTNMLQPFWALPLLGITKLKAQDILPFTLAALIVSGLVFIIGLLLIS
ncbi:MAG TPA: short-chain fatty acid transporter, partial [Flavobacteriales bacterium]|nr:short-chain fatty acid transporter [Flavobacteriales bacterium]